MPDRPEHPAAIALGSNLGDRRAHIAAAFDALGGIPRTRVIARSSVIETEPVGPAGQGRYLNAAALLHTSRSPRDLLNALLDIERSRGRTRAAETRWGPRTLDLDLLVYGGVVINEPGLVVPHPRLHERAFVLQPLAEIAPDLPVPGRGATAGQLLERLTRRSIA